MNLKVNRADVAVEVIISINTMYFDNSATTKVDPKVLDAMLPYLQEDYGNAGSIHSFGQKALNAVDTARDQVADFFGCDAQEIIFTSGATESNNIAIQGVVKSALKNNDKVHIIVSRIEHPAVLEVAGDLAKDERVEVDYLEVDEGGVIKLEQLQNKIKDNTVLVSTMFVNNEIGTIQPVKEISKMIRDERDKRDNKMPLYFHVDAVQAVNYLDCNVDELGVDLLSASGHKIYGPKGIGLLYVRKGVKLEPIVQGGHQEYKLRSGTHNVPAIVGLGVAFDEVTKTKKQEIKKTSKTKEKLIVGLEKIGDVRFNGDKDNQIPSIINVSFLKAEGESILMMLDMDGIAISTGSACSSGSLEPSHVLQAMGVKPEWSHGSIRISIGRFNSEDEVEPFIKSLTAIIEKLRKMAP